MEEMADEWEEEMKQHEEWMSKPITKELKLKKLKFKKKTNKNIFRINKLGEITESDNL